MPELPDVVVYIESLDSRLRGQVLGKVRLASPFLVRSYDPPLAAAVGRRVRGFRRLGKRIVFVLEGELYLVLHLMIAGRLRWRDPGAGIPGRIGLAAIDFPVGTLLLTEAGTKRRASLYVVAGEEGLASHDPGGVEVLDCTLESFTRALLRESHTLKRALTDPRLFSGIGNAYSDEILHAARLSPLRRTDQLDESEVLRLFEAARATLAAWLAVLRRDAEAGFPEGVTAFRDGMAVHGRYRLPCPNCATPVQRVRYADNETNYCPACQTGGRVLADRSLSRLLREDWPRTLEELEALRFRAKP
jgi:formamidopyrimidine-DNA glycosylase